VVAAEVAGPGLLPAFLVTGMLELWHDDRDMLVWVVLVEIALRWLTAVTKVAASVVSRSVARPVFCRIFACLVVESAACAMGPTKAGAKPVLLVTAAPAILLEVRHADGRVPVVLVVVADRGNAAVP